MTSNDNTQYITVEAYNNGIAELKLYIQSENRMIHNELKELKSEILAVRDIALINSAKIDAYRDFTGIWFTVIAIIVALVAIMTTFAPMFREMYRDAKQSRNDKKLRDIIREEVDMAVNRTLNIK